MDVKDIIDRVRSKLTDEQRSEVGSDLETIKSGYLEKVDEAKAAVAESMERKRKLREQKDELEELTIDRDTWKTKYESHDDSSLIKERDQYKEKWNSYLDTQKGKFQEFYVTAKDNDNWKKVANEYKIPDDSNGEIDWSKLESSDIENNIEKMNYHKNLGLFEHQPQKPTPPTDKAFKFSDTKIPTAEEYNELMFTKGMNHPDTLKAKNLIQKHERGEI